MAVVPALLVAVGYLVLLRALGLRVGFLPLLVFAVVLAAAVWALARRGRTRARSS